MNFLQVFRTPAAMRSASLSLAFVIGIGAALVVLADARLIEYNHPLYFLGENLLIIGGVMGLALAVLTWLARPAVDDETASGLPTLSLALIAVASGGIALVLLAQNRGSVAVYDAAIGILIAVSMYITFNMTDEGGSRTAPTVDPVSVGIGLRSVAIGVAVILAVTGVLRLVAAPFDLLTYILAPITVFIVPGLALTLALRDTETPVFAHVALIPVLSVASQMIVVAWLLWLRVPVTPLAMLAACTVITIAGLTVRLVADRRELPSPS